jgi:hypothetical protein
MITDRCFFRLLLVIMQTMEQQFQLQKKKVKVSDDPCDFSYEKMLQCRLDQLCIKKPTCYPDDNSEALGYSIPFKERCDSFDFAGARSKNYFSLKSHLMQVHMFYISSRSNNVDKWTQWYKTYRCNLHANVAAKDAELLEDISTFVNATEHTEKYDSMCKIGRRLTKLTGYSYSTGNPRDYVD